MTTPDSWVIDLYRAVDSMDAGTLAKVFTDDGTFRFGNSEPAVGSQQIEQNAAGFFSMLEGLSHEITGVWTGTWEQGEVTSVEAEVTCTGKAVPGSRPFRRPPRFVWRETGSRTAGSSWTSRPSSPTSPDMLEATAADAASGSP